MRHLESFTGAGSSVTGERRVSLATAFIERCGIGDGEGSAYLVYR